MPRPQFKTYHQLDEDYILSDMHMHSTWTDGLGTIEQNILTAKNIGLKRIAATDHIRKDSTYFENYCEEIKKLRGQLNFEIYIGFEAKVDNFEGDIDVSEKNLSLSEISICSVHRFPVGRKLIPAKAFSPDVSQEIELELSIAAINRGGFSVMGHPGGMSIRAHQQFKKEYFEEIIVACKKNEIAFDYNASYHKNVKEDLMELFKLHNPLISIGSDAHKPESIGSANKLLF
jgi:putative hydrolase